MSTDPATPAPTPLPPVPTGALVGGQWLSAGRPTFAVEDPATGAALTHVTDCDDTDALAALDAADRAQAAWAATPARRRADILMAAFELVHERAELFAQIMTLEMGKPLRESRGEVAYGAEFLRWFAEEAVRIGGEHRAAPAGTGRILTGARPVGPCLLITPWNFPLAMGTRKLGPALAAGCTAIVKPAPQTPLTMLLLAQVLVEAGVPEGVVSVLPTTRAEELCAPLLADRRVRKLSFTGSTGTGRHLMRACADTVKRVSLELGGNAPLLVFDDASLEHAVEGTLQAKLRNMGEACTAANRVLVQRGIAPAFVEALTERMAALRVGPGMDESSDVGPLIDEPARERILARLGAAVRDGAEVRTGGHAVGERGWFLAPTVVTGVAPAAELSSEEIFGPVAPISVFDHEDEAVAAANASEYGLAAYLFTESLDRAFRVTDKLEAGMVGVNRGVISDPAAPFGGVKQSGLGREGGREGIHEYLETTYMALR